MGRITAGVRHTALAERLRFGYGVARLGLLVSAILTALNCIFVVLFNGIFYSGFAFTCPYILISDGLFWTGRLYTPEEYEAYWGMTQTDMIDVIFLYLTIGIALLAVGVLVVCYIFSKRHVGFLIAAVVLLAADKLYALIWVGVSVNILPGVMMSAGLFTILIIGIVSHFWLRMLEWTRQVPVSGLPQSAPASEDAAPADSPVLHVADYSEKGKFLMLTSKNDYMIGYRKIGEIRELEIDRKVYDTIDVGKYEQPHELCAYVDGHEIAVGLDMDGTRYLRFDGETVKQRGKRI